MSFDDDFRAVLRELDERSVPAMVVGAIALEQYGRPRTTYDIDVQVLLEGEPPKQASVYLGILVEQWTRDPIFSQDVLLGHVATTPTPVELFVTTHWFTRQAFARRVPAVSAFPERFFVPTREDLILLKACFHVAPTRGRGKASQDGVDIENLIADAPALDMVYLRGNAEKLGVWDIITDFITSAASRSMR